MTDGPLEDDLRQEIEAPLVTPAADGPAIGLQGDDTLDRHLRRELLKEERAIALPFHGGRMWVYPVLTVACFALWASARTSRATRRCIRTSIRAGTSTIGRTS